MTDTQLPSGWRATDAEIRALLDGATEGPWKEEPGGGKGSWIKGVTGEWSAMSCGNTHNRAAGNARLIAVAPDLAAEVLRLREALAWYGEQARLCRLIHSEGDAGRNALHGDGGERARAALPPVREGEAT